MYKLKTVEVNGEKYDALVYDRENDISKLIELRSVDVFAHTEDGYEIARGGDLSTFKRSIVIGRAELADSEVEEWVDDQVRKLNDPTDLTHYF